jgi:hypothetical protein
VAAGLITAETAAASEKPNLVWIMADDLGYGDLDCYGQKVIQTPHLDRMAREGMRFTQFYAGATVCGPSCSVVMTGQHHGHTRVRGNVGRVNPAAQALRKDDFTVCYDSNLRRCVRPEQVAHFGLRAHVEVTDARTFEASITCGWAVRAACAVGSGS